MAQKKVKLINGPLQQFGFEYGEIHEPIDCPEEHRVSERLRKSVWIWSPKRNEPVRLLKGEFEFVN